MYDPRLTAETVKNKVVDGLKRRYYRLVRGGAWYGGIATSDCCGCNLNCVFCWSNFPKDNPDKCGKFYTPKEVFEALVKCAKKMGYGQIRISGNEPTIAEEHLLELLNFVETTDFRFILETNGTLIDRYFARQLSKFTNLYVRVSFKGTNPEEFSLLTGALPIGFELQLKAVENLLYYGVKCWVCVVVSFSPYENVVKFKNIIKEISATLADEIEEETIFLLPHIKKRLDEKKIKPLVYEDMKVALKKECEGSL